MYIQYLIDDLVDAGGVGRRAYSQLLELLLQKPPVHWHETVAVGDDVPLRAVKLADGRVVLVGRVQLDDLKRFIDRAL